jgi:hypothetical protein
MAALILKQIERGSVSFASTDVTKTVTLATPLTTDTSKTMLLFSVKTNTAAPISFLVRGTIVSITQIEFNRASTPAADCDVEYEVIEFKQGIYVQHISGISMVSTTVNTTISSVDTTKSFVITSNMNTGSTWGSDDFVYGDLTTSTNLALVIDSTASADRVDVQVVQIDDAVVQKITDTFGTGDTKDITVTTITEDKTFWFFGVTSNATTYMKDVPYLSYVNSTTLRFTRANAAGIDFTIKLFVVSLTKGIIVQNIITTIASSDSTVSPTIPTAIEVPNTSLNISGVNQRFATSNTTSDNAAYSSFALSALSATQFTATRAAAASLAATTNVQVLEFSTATTIEPDNLFDKCFDTCFEPGME